MSFEEYWIGKGVDYKELWENYEEGRGYLDKYRSMEVHLLQLSFQQYAPDLPLFNLEAIFKTSKGIFHDLKKSYLSPADYDRAGPMFIYDISRGSEKWRFLGELKPLLLFGIAVWTQIRKGTEQYKAERIALIDGLLKRFPNADLKDIMKYVNSLPGREQEVALEKLYGQNLRSVEISKVPFTGNISQSEKELVSFKDVISTKDKKGT
ncbi:MAG TPA: hypothetical protein VEI74_04810 [Candidatus Methylomirabilis sp.]|nr:hypothetical protein [Candidatus Methylomirabilis sp.]